MSRLDRAVGLARSLAIYHGIPGRQRRLRGLYRAFVRPGDLVFDVGAHVGNRVRAFRSLGCRVVAVEPQPDFARVLRTLFGRSSAVSIVEAGVGLRPGRAVLSLSERTPTVTTMRESWRDARSRDADFAGVAWNRQIEIETTTMDDLIARFGAPAFVKIDAEGSEAVVLKGLSTPIPALSFEYLPRAVDEVAACTAALARLGRYEYNWSIGESSQLSEGAWLDGDQLMVALRTSAAQRRPGDVYARLI